MRNLRVTNRVAMVLAMGAIVSASQEFVVDEPPEKGAVRLNDAAPVLADSSFIYRGQLSFQNAPVDGAVDLEFRLFAEELDLQPMSPAVIAEGWPIADGSFLVGLDFGTDLDLSSGAWMEVCVDGVILSPRQYVMPRGWVLRGTMSVEEYRRAHLVDRNDIVDVDADMDGSSDQARDTSDAIVDDSREGHALVGPSSGRGGNRAREFVPSEGTDSAGLRSDSLASGRRDSLTDGAGSSGAGFLFAAGDRYLSSTDSVYINIDADNNDADTRMFEIGKNRYDDVGGTSLLRINENGNLGIRTDSPTANLFVDGTGSTHVGFQMEAPGDASGRIQMGSPRSHTGIAGSANNGNRRDIWFMDQGLGLFTRATTASPFAGNGLFIDDAGRVGIGTITPTRQLQVETSGSTVGLHVDNNGGSADAIDVFASGSGIGLDIAGDTNSSGDQIRLQPRGSSRGLNIYATSSNSAITAWNDGSGDAVRVFGEITFDNFVTNLPMINMFDEGTGNPARMVLAHSPAFPTWGLQYVDSADDFAFIGAGAESVRIDLNRSDVSLAGGGHIVMGALSGPNIAIDINEIMARNNGGAADLHLNNEGGNVIVGNASGGSSTLRTPVLQITGGSDLSEMFDVGGDVDATPGMVVVIDSDNPGRLLPSTTPYDRKVAGIISGAGGIATGMRMGHDGTIADGEHPVALSGRVYCLVDAADGPIKPGDLLTTSSMPGHAMRASDLIAAQGAIIGKAMTSLEEGEVGLVLVLVNLQ